MNDEVTAPIRHTVPQGNFNAKSLWSKECSMNIMLMFYMMMNDHIKKQIHCDAIINSQIFSLRSTATVRLSLVRVQIPVDHHHQVDVDDTAAHVPAVTNLRLVVVT